MISYILLLLSKKNVVRYRKSQKVLAQTKLICFNKYRCRVDNADLAQLAEHVISNDEVGGSNPLVSIIKIHLD